MACAICGAVQYCDKVCQKVDWKAGHKAVCTELTEIKNKMLYQNLRRAKDSSAALRLFNQGLTAQMKDDFVSAVRFFEKASDLDYPPAQSNLAVLLRHGTIGVPGDAKRAALLFQKACDAGDTIAMFNYAQMLHNGEGMSAPDKEAAFKMCLRSAEGGDDDAARLVARCYRKADGCAQNLEEAVKWDARASRVGPSRLTKGTPMDGLMESLQNLSTSLKAGKGIPQDKTTTEGISDGLKAMAEMLGFTRGARVTLSGLTNPALNGMKGSIVKDEPDDERYAVQCDDGVLRSVRPRNMISDSEKLRK